MNEINSKENITCPSCGSSFVKIIIEKKNEDFDIPSGVIGYICMGPIGLLCGLCCADGEKDKTTCICNNCGTRFNG
ncbi:hypothetical protein D3C76_1443030 [compost metagenome]